MAILNDDQIAFARMLAHTTGLHPEVVGAWALAEEPASRSPDAQGHNWLNLLSHAAYEAHGGRTYSGVPVLPWTAAFARFGSVSDAVKEASVWINDFSNYAGIRASVGKSSLAQVDAIAASPWDAGHYGNGAAIRGTLAEVQRSGIFAGQNHPPNLPWWHVVADGRTIARTQHPKRYVLTHRLFSRHDDIRFHK